MAAQSRSGEASYIAGLDVACRSRVGPTSEYAGMFFPVCEHGT